jgi:hypothetical protein
MKRIKDSSTISMIAWLILAMWVVAAVSNCSNAQAEGNRDSPLEITWGGVSYHFPQFKYPTDDGKGETSDVNSFHKAFILSKNKWSVGYFENSFYDDTFAVGRYWALEEVMLSARLHVLATYGYRESTKCYKPPTKPRFDDKKRVCPTLFPEIVFKTEPVRASVALYGFNTLVLSFNHILP